MRLSDTARTRGEEITQWWSRQTETRQSKGYKFSVPLQQSSPRQLTFGKIKGVHMQCQDTEMWQREDVTFTGHSIPTTAGLRSCGQIDRINCLYDWVTTGRLGNMILFCESTPHIRVNNAVAI